MEAAPGSIFLCLCQDRPPGSNPTRCDRWRATMDRTAPGVGRRVRNRNSRLFRSLARSCANDACEKPALSDVRVMDLAERPRSGDSSAALGGPDQPATSAATY